MTRNVFSPGSGQEIWAIVPVKTLHSAKRRLMSALPPETRARLVLAMLRDVIETLRRVSAIGRCLVVTPSEEVASVAESMGASLLLEGELSGLNMAISKGLAEAARNGCTQALVIPGDVPLATASEVAQLLPSVADGTDITIVPDAKGSGTNALVLSPTCSLQPAFGSDSFARHMEQAKKLGLRARVIRLDGLSHDIDVIADLDRLEPLKGYEFLSEKPTICTVRPISFGVDAAEKHERLDRDQALALAESDDLDRLAQRAHVLCAAGHGTKVSFSKKVFIPLTQLCRDVCHYCTFAHAPKPGEPVFLSREQVLDIARRGAAAGCKEALFTLGDKPEQRYAAARQALQDLGHATTLSYLEECARLVFEETGLLPHINAGVMSEDWMRRFRTVSVSQGLMLETILSRLSAKGGPHYGSPDKDPKVRLAMIDAAGRAAVPFTTGLLIGIGETRRERVEALLALRASHERYGHIQEIIIQNFRAKPGTKMSTASEPPIKDHVWTIAAARLIFGPHMNIQAPPNLRPNGLAKLLQAGINDWGGVSPVTPDYVNPEAPWPHLDRLHQATAEVGRVLVERLAIYPEYLGDPDRWLMKPFPTAVLRASDSEGFAREDLWFAGQVGAPLPAPAVEICERAQAHPSPEISSVLDRLEDGCKPDERDLVALFSARGKDFSAVCQAADHVRRKRCGDTVTYVVNRNINYTNLCTYGCRFCAFSKGRLSVALRDKPYKLDLKEIEERTRQAETRGATEVCLQGGIAPGYSGHTYLDILHAVRAGAPDIHVHAFSPLEVWHGAETLDVGLYDYLTRLKAAGLSSLPGTAAEILDDEVRRVLCRDKINTEQWLNVMETAHNVGLRSTATIMFGHIDSAIHWARHLLRVRGLQERTGGFTEFVPLSFVHMEAPIHLKGDSRKGPTFREALLMHAVARLALDPVITNIQASWVKMGPECAALCLDAGCNDLGGTLMNESITRAAGAGHGQEMTPIELERLMRGAGRKPRQRTTFYGEPSGEQLALSFSDCEMRPMSIMAAE